MVSRDGATGNLQMVVALLGAVDIEDGQLVEVVRCRDCKHSCEDLGSLYCCSFGPCVYSSVSPDFWCANGKRREDAHAQD